MAATIQVRGGGDESRASRSVGPSVPEELWAAITAVLGVGAAEISWRLVAGEPLGLWRFLGVWSPVSPWGGGCAGWRSRAAKGPSESGPGYEDSMASTRDLPW